MQDRATEWDMQKNEGGMQGNPTEWHMQGGTGWHFQIFPFLFDKPMCTIYTKARYEIRLSNAIILNFKYFYKTSNNTVVNYHKVAG